MCRWQMNKPWKKPTLVDFRKFKRIDKRLRRLVALNRNVVTRKKNNVRLSTTKRTYFYCYFLYIRKLYPTKILFCKNVISNRRANHVYWTSKNLLTAIQFNKFSFPSNEPKLVVVVPSCMWVNLPLPSHRDQTF